MTRPLRRFATACVALTWLLAGCRDATAPQRVAHLVVQGAPAEPLIVGSNVQLRATPVDAQGDTLVGRTLTWSSSDPRIATVSVTGFVTGAAPGTAMVTVSTDGQSDTAHFDFRDGAVVGGAGGVVSLDSTARLTIPKGALTQALPIMVRAVAVSGDPHVAGADTYEFTPTSAVFQKPATLTLKYDRSRIPAGISQTTLVLGAQSGSDWLPIVGSAVDTVRGTVTAPVGEPAAYAVLWQRVARVAITGVTGPDSLYVGERMRLAAVPYDSGGFALPARTATWRSSASSIATVDSTGRLTAIAAGTTTITATIDGQTASLGMVVDGSVVVDWSHATDWGMFDGGASHDGHLAATIDPRHIHELWTSAMLSGGTTNPVVAGDSAVIVTTRGDGGMGRIAVLDAATGRLRWSYVFGGTSVVGPPAYVDGNVYLQTSAADSLYVWSFVASSGAIRFRTGYVGSWTRYFAPTVAGNVVYTGSDGGVQAVSAVDGSRKWFASIGRVATPAVGNGFVYAYTVDTAARVSAVDTATGVVSYTIPDSGFSYLDAPPPTLGGNHDLLVTNSNRLISFDLVSRTRTWQSSRGFTGAVTVGGGTVYSMTGCCAEALSEIDGSYQTYGPYPYGAGPPDQLIATDNLLIVANADLIYIDDLSSSSMRWTRQPGGYLAVNRRGELFIAGAAGQVTAIALGEP